MEDDEFWGEDEEMTEEEYAMYSKQVAESEGFDVEPFGPIMPGMIILSGNAFLEKLESQIALHHYNLVNDTEFEFVESDHRNVQLVAGSLHYLTFKAKSNWGSVLMFQAKLWVKVPGPTRETLLEVLFSRIKPSKGSEGESNLAKKQKIESAEDTKGKQVVSKEGKDLVCLDKNYEWLGDGDIAKYIADGRYYQQVMDSKGFDVSYDIPLMFSGQIMPLDASEYSRNLIPVLSEYVMFNYEVMVGENQYLELEGITKANVQTNLLELAGMPFKAKNANYYITFTAKDIERNFTKTLQALIYKRVLEDGVMQIAIISTRLLSTVEGK